MLLNRGDSVDDDKPVVVRDEDIVLRLSDDAGQKSQLLTHVVVKSIVAARAANVDRLRVIPDNGTSLTVTLGRSACLSVAVGPNNPNKSSE